MCVSAIHTHMHIHIDRYKAFFKFTNFAELPGVQVELGILCFIQCTWSWFAIPEFLHPLAWLYASSLTSMHSLACPCLASVVFSLSLPVTCGLVSFPQMQGRPRSCSSHTLPGCIAHCHRLVTTPTGFCVPTLLEAGNLGYLCHPNKCLRQQVHKVSRFLPTQFQKFWSDSLLLLSAWGEAVPVGKVYGGANLLT